MKKPTIIDKMAHMQYTASQRHTRGDMARAKGSIFTPKKRLKGDIVVSDAVKGRADFVNPYTGNTSYTTLGGNARRVGEASIRVAGQHGGFR